MFLCFFIFWCFFPLNLNAQQNYTGNSDFDCDNQDQSFLYICNGKYPSCQAYLIFRSQSPYDSVPAISKLMGVDPLQIARINNCTSSEVFLTDKEVIVPVNCSCSGKYYQANSSYVIEQGDIYFTVASSTYQDLSTCKSLLNHNSYAPTKLSIGLEIMIPLRCACPTSKQIENGAKFLLTYPFSSDDNVSDLSQRFNVTERDLLDANELTGEEDPVIHPYTIVLIPLHGDPSSSQTRAGQLPILPKKKSSKKWVYIGGGIAAGASISILFIIGLSCFFFRRKKEKDQAVCQKKWVLPEEFLTVMANVDRSLRMYRFEDLQVATNNFSSEFKLKGSVYRGSIANEPVAIKKVGKDVTNEVNMLNKISHFNLIRLYGICFDRENCFLVYEFAENGSLKDWLHDEGLTKILSWTQRIQIALDVADGLQYLHNYTEPAYVHKDIKSSNVLLNRDLRAKIANFSLARSQEEQEGGFALTKHVVGTKGYMAPEYLETGLVTSKLDVYAFGVVILELISGKDVIIKINGGEFFLAEGITKIMEGENVDGISDFMDSKLQSCYPKDLALDMARLSASCLSKNPLTRPSMTEIMPSLSRILFDSRNWEFSNFQQSS